MVGDEKITDVAVEKAEDAGDKLHENNNEKNDTTATEKTVQAKGKQKLRHRYLNYEDRQRIWEEEQAKKTVIETAVKGKVKWYSVRYHYGFIERDGDEHDDIFVHQTAISKSRMRKSYLRSLDECEEVLFDVVEGRKGLEAANVTGPEGAAVRGNPMAGVFLMRRLLARREQRGDHEVRRDAGERRGRRRVSSMGSQHKELDDENETEGKTQKRRVRTIRARRHSEGDKEGKKDETVKEEGKKKEEGRRYRRKSDGKRGQRRRKDDEEKAEAEHEAKEDSKETAQSEEKQKDVSDIKTEEPAGGDVKVDLEKVKTEVEEHKQEVGEEKTEPEVEKKE